MRRENGVETNLSTNRFGAENFSITKETSDVPPLVRFNLSFLQQYSRNGGVDSRTATRCSSVVRLRNKVDVEVQ
jgi:hypothetical protein